MDRIGLPTSDNRNYDKQQHNQKKGGIMPKKTESKVVEESKDRWNLLLYSAVG